MISPRAYLDSFSNPKIFISRGANATVRTDEPASVYLCILNSCKTMLLWNAIVKVYRILVFSSIQMGTQEKLSRSTFSFQRSCDLVSLSRISTIQFVMKCKQRKDISAINPRTVPLVGPSIPGTQSSCVQPEHISKATSLKFEDTKKDTFFLCQITLDIPIIKNIYPVSNSLTSVQTLILFLDI